jgi:hypothetical protein
MDPLWLFKNFVDDCAHCQLGSLISEATVARLVAASR